MSKEFNGNVIFNVDGMEIAEKINDYQYDIPEIDFIDKVTELFIQDNPEVKDGNNKISVDLDKRSIEGKTVKVYEYVVYDSKNSGRCHHLEIPYKIKKKALLDNSYFGISEYANNEIRIKKYKIEYKEELEIIPVKEFIISEETIKDEKLKEEFVDIVNISDFKENLIRLFFGIFSQHKGMADIYNELKEAIKYFGMYIKNESVITQYEFFRNIYTEKFFCLIESHIKENIKYEYLYEANPVFTQKDFPERITYPKKLKEYIKEYHLDNDSDMKRISELIEQVGINYTMEFMDLYAKAHKTDFYFPIFIFEDLIELYKYVNIKPSVLMGRMIKAYFEENIIPRYYLKYAVDYCNMSKILKKDVTNIPKDLKEKHDKLQNQIQSVIVKQKVELFKAVSEKNKELLKYLPENKDYTIICPEKAEDLINEGMMLNHCVGSYINPYTEGCSKIFFVRQKNDMDSPYVTLELNKNNTLVQIKGFNNRKPIPEVINYVKEWVNNFGGQIYE